MAAVRGAVIQTGYGMGRISASGPGREGSEQGIDKWLQMKYVCLSV